MNMDGNISIIAAYILGFSGGIKTYLAATLMLHHRTCDSAATTFEAAVKEHPYLATTARDHHEHHSARVLEELFSKPHRRKELL